MSQVASYMCKKHSFSELLSVCTGTVLAHSIRETPETLSRSQMSCIALPWTGPYHQFQKPLP